MAINDFQFALLATSPDYEGELLRYSGFVTDRRGSSLLRVEPSFLELRMLKVDPKYFGRGVGKTLLDYSRKLSQERDEKLILKPHRPGEMTLEQFRVLEYPLTTEQLRAMYQRNGFRDFTRKEVDDLTRKIDEDYLTYSLWFAGIDPQTAAMTCEKRYSMTREQAASLKDISFERKLELMTEVLTSQYGHASALNSNRKLHRTIVDEHLIAVEN